MEEMRTTTLQQHQQAILEIFREFDRICKVLDIPYFLFAGSMLGAVRHQGYIPWDDDLDVMMLRPDYERFLREAEGLLDPRRFYLQKEYTEHWPMYFSKLRLNGTTCLEKYHPRDPLIHQGVYMDIFPGDNMLGSAFGRSCQFIASKVVVAKCLYRRGYDTDDPVKKLFMFLCRALPLKPFLALTKAGRPDSRWVNSFLGGSRSYAKSVYLRSWLEKTVPTQFEGGLYPIPAGYDEMLRAIYGDYMILPPPEDRKLKEHALFVDLEKSYEHYRHYRDGMKFDVYTRSIR